jgi:hypothetical protein
MKPLFLIAAVLLSGACRHDSVPETKSRTVGWSPIGTWSGRGSTQTDSFNIESGQWRIKWEATNENPPGAGTLVVTVHSAVSGRPLMRAVDHRGIGRDTAYVNEDPRLYHLVIESANLDWKIAVEEAVVAY